MRLGEGVEWGLHSCLVLAWLDDEAPIPSARLAAIHELPVAYLAKQMQALARAGIVTSTSGPRGGFKLARPASEVTFLDVVDAIEGGRASLFECTKIRTRGAAAGVPEFQTDAPCSIATAMHRAEVEWRSALQATTIADITRDISGAAPGFAKVSRVSLAKGEP